MSMEALIIALEVFIAVRVVETASPSTRMRQRGRMIRAANGRRATMVNGRRATMVMKVPREMWWTAP
jgi:hypothetical protein